MTIPEYAEMLQTLTIALNGKADKYKYMHEGELGCGTPALVLRKLSNNELTVIPINDIDFIGVG